MRRGLVVSVLSFGLVVGGMAEASVGGALKNVWTYLGGFVTCAVARGGALLDWVIETGTCALTTVNKNPVSLNPIVTVVPHAEVPNVETH